MKTYSPKKVQVIFGPLILTGYADDIVKVSHNADAFAVTIGADGEGARVASADRSGIVTVTLMQTSSSNDQLSAAYIADRAGNNATATLLVKDLSGTTLVHAREAWIKKLPEITFAKDSGTREWVFETADLDIQVVGGSK